MRGQRQKLGWQSKAVRCFWKDVGGRGPIDAVNQVCTDLLNRLGKKTPPFQTAEQKRYEYAKLLNIPVKEADLQCDGTLIKTGDDYIIRVQRKSSPERKNFTVCHEIGHIQILQHARYFLSQQSNCNSDSFGHSREEEDLSNLFARNLLMPCKIFRKYSCSCEPGIDSLLELANTFCTSLTATSFRLAELDLWPSVILWATPMTYYNGRLGLKKRRVFHSTRLISPFGKEEEVFVSSDIFHRTIDAGCRTMYNSRYKDSFGNIKVWQVQSMPQYFLGEKCVLVVATIKDSATLDEKPLVSEEKENSYI
jgi:Zn-dependent peptidase ImmA (M78 family)